MRVRRDAHAMGDMEDERRGGRVDLSIVVPCYNEQDNISPLFDAVERAFKGQGIEYELVLVNDGSSDETLRAASRTPLPPSAARATVVDFSRNFGKESAILAGLRSAEGACVAIMDADLQQPPAVLLAMYRELEGRPDIDCVAAYQEKRRENPAAAAVKELFYRAFNAVSSVTIVPDASDFRVFRASVARALLSMPEYFRFSKGMFSWVGFATAPYPYTPDERASGTTKWTFGRLLHYGVGGILSFTTFPLKLAAWVGAAASVLALVFIVETIVEWFATSTMPSGYPTLVCLILLFGGLILLTLGIIGEYIARIYVETKRRPSYIARSVEVREGVHGAAEHPAPSSDL